MCGSAKDTHYGREPVVQTGVLQLACTVTQQSSDVHNKMSGTYKKNTPPPNQAAALCEPGIRPCVTQLARDKQSISAEQAGLVGNVLLVSIPSGLLSQVRGDRTPTSRA